MIKESGNNLTSVNVSCSDSGSDSNDDEVSTVQEFEDYYEPQSIGLPGVDASNLATTVVKMTNSSNVEIKPVTKVTIHQYFRDSDHSTPSNTIPTISEYCSTKSSNGEAKLNEESKPQATLNTPRKKFYHAIKSSLQWKLGVILMLIIAVLVVVIVVYFTVLKEDHMFVQTNSSFPEETEYDLGNDLHIFTRERWAGREIRDGWQNRTVIHPIKLVVIGHTVTPQCMTFAACASRLQSIQDSHVSQWDYVDIGYNFLVGGDGNIYQALGWDIRNYLRIQTHSIQVQFIGSYTFDKVQERQRMGLQKLLELGIKLGKLDRDYFLVAHNQVANTQSPGKNILAEITSWPHYHNGTFT